MKKIEFMGLPSGDNECFCFEVDRETFVRFTGYEPEDYNRVRYYDYNLDDVIEKENLYFLYPDYIFKSDKKLNIKIEMTEA